MIHIKYCRECLSPFDVGTDYDLCPKCRNEITERNKEEVLGDEERADWRRS